MQINKDRYMQKIHRGAKGSEEDSDFVTEEEDADVQDENIVNEPQKPEYPKYRNIFTDLDAVFKDVECMILKTSNT